MASLLSIIILLCAFFSAKLYSSQKQVNKPNNYQFPIVTILLSAALVFAFTAQLTFPLLLYYSIRATTLIMSGELWRLVTALFFQDGGIAGAVFNIASLLFIGSVAEMQWGKRHFLIIFFVGGILSECIALSWQPIGAGNSIANFALAGSLLFITLKNGTGKLQIISLLGLISALVLLCMKDIHGSAVITGMIIGFLLTTKKIIAKVE